MNAMYKLKKLGKSSDICLLYRYGRYLQYRYVVVYTEYL